jgi:DNA-binding winged helix-turn-helix (wHTH) protein
LGNSKVFADSSDVTVQFGEFILDTGARRLIRKDGTDVHLSTKAFDLLRLLVERRPAVLDKAALHAHLWPRTFVVDANLTVLVAELRRALADNAREPRFIRTVHALGYSFCGDAVDLDSPARPAAGRVDARSPAGPATPDARCWLTWSGRAIILADGENIIGRDPDCSVWVDASGVSRRHARIEVERGADAVRLEDLGSKNGTFIDGSPVQGVVEAANGSVIQVGGVELTLRIWSRGRAKETERIARTPDDK